MNKPISVKIVEVLGWVYVALAVLLAGGAVAEACQPGYIDDGVVIFFAPLALAFGMVLSLRQGRRFWFLLGHTVIGLFGSHYCSR